MLILSLSELSVIFSHRSLVFHTVRIFSFTPLTGLILFHPPHGLCVYTQNLLRTSYRRYFTVSCGGELRIFCTPFTCLSYWLYFFFPSHLLLAYYIRWGSPQGRGFCVGCVLLGCPAAKYALVVSVVPPPPLLTITWTSLLSPFFCGLCASLSAVSSFARILWVDAGGGISSGWLIY